jgi:hypothetical protein
MKLRNTFIVLFLLLSLTSVSPITGNFLTVRPQAGDNYAYLQAIIRTAITKKIKTIIFRKGDYPISKPLLIEDNGKFVSLNLIGEDAAHFNLEESEARIICNFTEGFAIGYQLARSSMIKGLVIYGQGRGKDTRFDVYAGISIDPYYRGNTSGSSGILIQQCRIRNFTVGIIISQNGVTLNGENIHVEKVAIDHVKAAYVSCQRQSKQNTVRDLICWDNIETVFEGKEYGQGLGVMPYIDGANIASYTVGKIFNYGPQLSTTSAQKIFAETITQVGNIDDGGVGVTIRDSYFDFAFFKFPSDYHFKGNRIKFENCAFRYYDDQNNKRIVIAGIGNDFFNCYFDLPPLMQAAAEDELGRTNYYFNIGVVPSSKMRVVAHSEIETWQWLLNQTLDVEKKTVTLDRDVVTKRGDYLVTHQPFRVVGRIVSQEGRTLYIDDIPSDIGSGWFGMGINGFKQ